MEQHYNNIYEQCKAHMHAYVLVEMSDGARIDGIITGIDRENVYLAVPIDNQMQHQERQFGFGGPGGPGYGHGAYGPGPRFSRLVLPLTFLAAVSLLPWY